MRRTHDARIALLDEDQQTRDMLREYLEGQGMHVVPVANGTELRQLVSQEPIDAVILDVMARGEDPLACCARWPNSPARRRSCCFGRRQRYRSHRRPGTGR
jgi:two-component system OmpR family response regulator